MRLGWLLTTCLLVACGTEAGDGDASAAGAAGAQSPPDGGASGGSGGRAGGDAGGDASTAAGDGPGDASVGDASGRNDASPQSMQDGGSAEEDAGGAGAAGGMAMDAAAVPLTPGTVVDAGPGVLPPPDGGSLGTVTECPPAQPSENVTVLCGPTGALSLDCTYGEVTCSCNGLGWYCVRDDGCSVSPRPAYACDNPGQRCAHAADVECLCLPGSRTWYCAGPTGCSVTAGNYDCDPALKVYCDYHDGRRCRCNAEDDWQCVPQACGFDPTHGQPCADAPSDGCANEAGDVCWCDDSSGTWDCYENGCLGPVVELTQCDLFNPISEARVCEYPDRVCTCMPSSPVSLWYCNPR